MWPIPVGLVGPLIKAGIALAVAAALWFAFHAFTAHYEAIGAASVQVQWDADKARRIQQVADMTLLWNDKRIEAEKAAQERDSERAKRIEIATTRARSLPATVAGVRVGAPAVRVLNDAIDASNTAAAGTADKPTEAPPAAAESADTTVGLLTEWGVACIAAYDEARGMVQGWQDWYASLRAAQPKEEP